MEIPAPIWTGSSWSGGSKPPSCSSGQISANLSLTWLHKRLFFFTPASQWRPEDFSYAWRVSEPLALSWQPRSQQVVGAGDYPPWIFLWSCFRTRSSNKADVGLHSRLPPCNMAVLYFQFFPLEMKYKMVNRSFFEFLLFAEITQVWLPFNLKEEPKVYYSEVQSQVCTWLVLISLGIVLQIDSKSLQSYILMSNLLL